MFHRVNYVGFRTAHSAPSLIFVSTFVATSERAIVSQSRLQNRSSKFSGSLARRGGLSSRVSSLDGSPSIRAPPWPSNAVESSEKNICPDMQKDRKYFSRRKIAPRPFCPSVPSVAYSLSKPCLPRNVSAKRLTSVCLLVPARPRFIASRFARISAR